MGILEGGKLRNKYPDLLLLLSFAGALTSQPQSQRLREPTAMSVDIGVQETQWIRVERGSGGVTEDSTVNHLIRILITVFVGIPRHL